MEFIVEKGWFTTMIKRVFGAIFNPLSLIKFVVVLGIASVIYVSYHNANIVKNLPVHESDMANHDELVTMSDKIEAIIESKLKEFDAKAVKFIDDEYETAMSKSGTYTNKYGFVVIKSSNGCYSFRDDDNYVYDYCGTTYAEAVTEMNAMIQFKKEKEKMKSAVWSDVTE